MSKTDKSSHDADSTETTTTETTTGVTRPERIERAERDTGNPDDTVFITDGARRTAVCYHDDAECAYIADAETLRELTREAAKSQWRTPCKRCILGPVDNSGPNEWTCPFCGESVLHPPAHLPCSETESEGGDSA